MTTDVKSYPPDQIVSVLKTAKLLKNRDNLSLSKMAKQVDMANSTLSQILSGTYEGHVDKYIEKLDRWINSHKASADIALRMGEEISFFPSSNAQKVMNVLQFSYSSPSIGIVVGKPGLGKTATALEMQKNHNRVYLVQATESICTSTLIIREFISSIGIPLARSNYDNIRNLREHLNNMMSLLIVDEAQFLKTGALEELRCLHDFTGAGVALLGNPKVVSNVRGQTRSDLNAQLTSRIGMQETLGTETPPGDIDMLLDRLKIDSFDHREFLTDMGKRPGALRTVVKIVQLARMSAPDGADDEELLNFFKLAARKLSFQRGLK